MGPESDFYERMLDSMAIGVFITDHLGKVVFVNQAMLKIVEITKEEFLQSDLRNVSLECLNAYHQDRAETKRILYVKTLNTSGGNRIN